MTPPRFGTDGIRARFGEEPLVEPTVRRIGFALGVHLGGRATAPLVLVGGDTRGSTAALADWAARGLSAAGARPVDVGVLPTPAVARLVTRRGATAGLVVSASHNPASDNGLKLISADGYKWDIVDEQALEARIDATPVPADGAAAPRDGRRASEEYLDALVAAAGGDRPLAGLRIALDCANGAASKLAGTLFERLGGRVTLLHCEPDGANINRDCGSTHPESLAERIRSGGFDLGFAFDGDADRAMLVDERGAVRDGDAMLVVWATALAARGELDPPRIVATSMSNLGLERALAPAGIGVERCAVGDRSVVETLRAQRLRLGGEQSGHLVDLARSTTGDGLLTATTLAGIVAGAGRPVSELLAGFRRFPQVLLNVPVRAKPQLSSLPEVAAATAEVERTLGADGRLVLRYSGTEPLARVMLEGPDEKTIRALAERVVQAIRGTIGAA